MLIILICPEGLWIAFNLVPSRFSSSSSVTTWKFFRWNLETAIKFSIVYSTQSTTYRIKRCTSLLTKISIPTIFTQQEQIVSLLPTWTDPSYGVRNWKLSLFLVMWHVHTNANDKVSAFLLFVDVISAASIILNSVFHEVPFSMSPLLWKLLDRENTFLHLNQLLVSIVPVVVYASPLLTTVLAIWPRLRYMWWFSVLSP